VTAIEAAVGAARTAPTSSACLTEVAGIPMALPFVAIMINPNMTSRSTMRR